MINRELLQPKSIVVIGGSNNTHKPGGAIVRNLINGGFDGTLRIVNPKEDEVQGIKVFHDITELPPTEMAILVIPAKMCPDTVEALAASKGARAFIIISTLITVGLLWWGYSYVKNHNDDISEMLEEWVDNNKGNWEREGF